jgi:predicted transcriptional regulator
MKDSNRQRIAELEESGMKPADMAKELGLSKGRVSQLIAELRAARARDPVS